MDAGSRKLKDFCMPALRKTALISGWSAMIVAILGAREGRSVMSSSWVEVPGREEARAASRSARRPVMMRCFPRAWKRQARASPMPDVPPMRRMVENEDVILRQEY